jgi:hypothetical protein
MSCAVVSTCPSGGRLKTEIGSPTRDEFGRQFAGEVRRVGVEIGAESGKVKTRNLCHGPIMGYRL